MVAAESTGASEGGEPVQAGPEELGERVGVSFLGGPSVDLTLLTRTAALIAVLATGVVYGTDVFCAVVLRPALAPLDDAALVTVSGHVHQYGDRRMPVAGGLGLVATAVATVTAAAGEHWTRTAAAGVALLVWVLVYLRISSPINRTLTAAAESGRPLADGRVLQGT